MFRHPLRHYSSAIAGVPAVNADIVVVVHAWHIVCYVTRHVHAIAVAVGTVVAIIGGIVDLRKGSFPHAFPLMNF